MMNYNQKLIVSGFALLLFGIITVLAQSQLTFIFGVLGLFFGIIGCFVNEKMPGVTYEKI